VIVPLQSELRFSVPTTVCVSGGPPPIIMVLLPVNVPPSSAVTAPSSFAGSKGAFGPGERNPLQMTTYLPTVVFAEQP